MKRFLSLLVLSALLAGCTDPVPPGCVGRIKTVSGFGNTILQPGRHACWGRDTMWTVETRDKTFTTDLSVLLETDQVPFGVVIATTVTLKEDKGIVLPLFNKVQPNSDKFISLNAVFKTYAARILNSVPRDYIRQRSIEQILGNVSALEDEIEAAVVSELSSSPLHVIGLSLTRFEFPEFIVKAQERAKEREIEIKETRMAADKLVVQLEGEKRAMDLRYDIEMIEAKKIADANRLVGESLLGESGNRYLRWHEIKVYGQAAVGPNNTIFLPLNVLQERAVFDVSDIGKSTKR